MKKHRRNRTQNQKWRMNLDFFQIALVIPKRMSKFAIEYQTP